jgi:hypothetical protein
MTPANQRLNTDDAVGAQVELRLVVQTHRVAIQGVLHLAHQRQLGCGIAEQTRVEAGDRLTVPAGLFDRHDRIIDDLNV